MGTRGKEYDSLKGRYGDLEGKYATRGREYDSLQGRYKTRGQEYDTLSSRLEDKERTLNRANTDRRRQDYGSSRPVSGGSSRTGASGLSSDAERQALLTGDYSFL